MQNLRQKLVSCCSNNNMRLRNIKLNTHLENFVHSIGNSQYEGCCQANIPGSCPW